MAKCTRCGKSGLFLKLKDGLCSNCQAILKTEKEQEELTAKVEELTIKLQDQQALYDKIEAEARDQALKLAKSEEEEINARVTQMTEQVKNAQSEYSDLQKKADSATRKVQKGRELIKAIEHATEEYDVNGYINNLDWLSAETDEFLKPTVTLELQCLGMRDLRKKYRQNEKTFRRLLKNIEVATLQNLILQFIA